MGEIVAAIDCGTNSTRMLIGESTRSTEVFRTLDRRMMVTRMGEGVDSRRRFADPAVERVLGVLAGYRQVM
ncbi:MAG TPA: exopolyphosphatase, partial [Acidimicrobiaceae bacterium]|nr:exopolyphosphatase [Acidimicrobiaceae bacterium]